MEDKNKKVCSHELMDRSFMIMEMVGNYLSNHIEDEDAYIDDEATRQKIKKRIEDAHTALFDVYQMCGEL